MLLKKIISYAKKDLMFSISFLCAAASFLFSDFTINFIQFIDFKVLCMLASLMAVVKGLESCNLFAVLANKLMMRCNNLRTLTSVLVLLPFFVAMAVTNDVALLTLVPFSIYTLKAQNREDLICRTVILEAISANLGSMATPVGNPQNLFLYSFYNLGAVKFFNAVLPVTAASFIIILLMTFFVKAEPINNKKSQAEPILDCKKLCFFLILFALCLLSVFSVVNYIAATAIVVIIIFVVMPKAILKVDYTLIATFICFFIFSGNIGQITFVKEFLQGILSKNTLIFSVLTSQIISNVPAAVLLSTFTSDWKALLLGVNIGGLGTPIASLASVIAIKYYYADCSTVKKGFICKFMLLNIIVLAILSIFTFVFLFVK